MKILFFLISMSVGQNIFSQIILEGDIRGVLCEGGLGLCGVVDVSALSLKINESTFSEFHLIVNEDHISPIDFDVIGQEEVFFQLQDDVTMDDETIYAKNLNPNKRTVKQGLYPISYIQGQIKIKFLLI